MDIRGIKCAGLLVVLAVCIGVFTGCSNRSTQGAPPQTETVQQEANYLDPSAESHRASSEYIHDFGLVRPSEKVTYRFKITNTSETEWTFKRFHINCVCTVTHASRPSISPNESAEVEVTYKAPSSNSDDRRSVQVEFSEPDAPFVSLVVKARVREPLTVTSGQLSFNRVGRGEKPEQSFEIHNFSDHDWSSISLNTSSPWVTVQSVFVGTGNGPLDPRQVWRVVVQADTAELPSGRHQGVVEISIADGESARTSPVPVSLLVASPVDAIPGDMFFGTVRPSEPSTRKVLLSFASANAKQLAKSIVVAHDLGPAFSLEWGEASDRFLVILGTLRPDSTQEFLEGEISLTFADSEMPRVQIPVRARVKDAP